MISLKRLSFIYDMNVENIREKFEPGMKDKQLGSKVAKSLG